MHTFPTVLRHIQPTVPQIPQQNLSQDWRSSDVIEAPNQLLGCLSIPSNQDGVDVVEFVDLELFGLECVEDLSGG
jgi:hypothetical protein